MKVWIFVMDGPDGIDIRAYKTYDLLLNDVASDIADWWAEDMLDEDDTPLPMPEHYQERLDMYIREVDDAWIYIREQEVVE